MIDVNQLFKIYTTIRTFFFHNPELLVDAYFQEQIMTIVRRLEQPNPDYEAVLSHCQNIVDHLREAYNVFLCMSSAR